MVGNFFKNLFKSSEEPSPSKTSTSVTYDSYKIIAAPFKSGAQWQVSGRIEKTFGDTTKTHEFIRADTLPTETDASIETIRKAKVMIDQQGDGIFD